ncbi:MAG: hypothetical protein H6722_12470 [Sandaracinus sp.]|nr:hypothetical protein [Myxococcales bacterium]MCB9613259.1 hypothetical protein [Sandaracinus sp.]
MKKKPDPILEGLRGITDADATVRRAAYVTLTSAGALDLLDLREVASLAAYASLHDPALEVRVAAAELVRHRADEGYDAGFGVAAAYALLDATDTPDVLRTIAKEIVQFAESRTPTARWYEDEG